MAMNSKYSFQAFLITALLFGILYLTLYSIKLTKQQEVVLESYDVEYSEELLLPEEELEELIEAPQTAIETNRAYNEAEKFIKSLENERDDAPDETTEQKLAKLDAAIAETYGNNNGARVREAKKRIEETKQKLEESKRKNSTKLESNGTSRKTTISYRLVERKALALPNPVYTCDGGGKVVISIQVSDIGKVVKMDFNKNLSTTTNGCLIDSALEYASKARFTSKSGKSKQLGTITYNFPGQR